MSNHYHVILNINTGHAKTWSDHDVVERWHRLFNGTVLSQELAVKTRKVFSSDSAALKVICFFSDGSLRQIVL
jgi:hypothetical protein